MGSVGTLWITLTPVFLENRDIKGYTLCQEGPNQEQSLWAQSKVQL